MRNSDFKYRLLVLVDFSKTSLVALADAVNLAKVVDGKIDLLYVKPSSKFTRYSNQIALMREVDEERASGKKRMKKLVATIAETENVAISYNFTYGNVINEVQNHIDDTTPDIVVIGKRKSRFSSIFAPSLTNHLLKNQKGGILISGNEANTRPFTDVSLGFINELAVNQQPDIADELINKSKQPLKVFKTSNNISEQVQSTNKKVITFEFDDHAEPSTLISKYVNKNKIDLLCVQRSVEQGLSKSIKNLNNEIDKTIVKTEVPVLVLAN